MDKRVKILLIVFGALVVLSGGYFGYMSMIASEEAGKAVATAPVRKKAPPKPAPAAAPAQPSPETAQAATVPAASQPAPPPVAAPVAGKPAAAQPAPAPVAGKPAPAAGKPVPGKPAPVAGKPAPAAKPAAVPYEPVIKAVEQGKEAAYKTPDEFLAKTKLAPDDIRALSARMTADAEKSLEDANAKKDKAAVEKAGQDSGLAAKLAQAVAAKFPPKAAAQSGERQYFSLGKRDPFMSPLEVPKVYPKVSATASPLEQVSTESLVLKAIMWNSKGYRALVLTPDGRGFTVKVGDTLGNKKGKITKITEKRVFVVEKITDILGDVETRNIVLTLHKEAR